MNGDFYVGYQPRAAESVGRWVRATVLLLILLAALVAVALVLAQAPFAAATFEYGIDRPYTGLLVTAGQLPLLLPNGETRALLLVGPGKFGVAGEMIAAAQAGRRVTLRGSRIGASALQVDPATVRIDFAEPARVAGVVEDLGPVTLVGEIVDTKCHFGVMNPGSGKVHRDCAARCLSGGVPPGLLVRDASGRLETFLLTGVSGRDLVDLAAEPVRVQGKLTRVASAPVLHVHTLVRE
jgi:hypothetical protein